MSNAASQQSVPDHRSSTSNTAINPLPEGYDVARMDEWCEEQATKDASVLVPLVHGFCFAIRRELRESIGMFDEQAFPSGYGEENDFCLRASNAGYLLAVALHTFVFHEKSQSFGSEERMALMKNGADKMSEIHGRERIVNAVRSMKENPAFVRLRHLSTALPYTLQA
jgi:GT2 family glycosyltransferase